MNVAAQFTSDARAAEIGPPQVRAIAQVDLACEHLSCWTPGDAGRLLAVAQVLIEVAQAELRLRGAVSTATADRAMDLSRALHTLLDTAGELMLAPADAADIEHEELAELRRDQEDAWACSVIWSLLMVGGAAVLVWAGWRLWWAMG